MNRTTTRRSCSSRASRWATRALGVMLAAMLLGVSATASVADTSHTYAYTVTDPLVAPTSHAVPAPGTGDINTAFWVLSGLTTPVGFCVPTTWSIGPDGFTVHPNNGSIGVPVLWAFGGDFAIKVFIEVPVNGRSGFGVLEYTDLSSPLIAVFVVHGGGEPGGPADTVPPSVLVPSGGPGSYYLFRKQGGTLTIQKGDAVGVSDTSPVVASATVGAGDLFTVGGGLGCPSVTDPAGNLTGFVRVRDFVLQADVLVPFPPNTASPPSEWLNICREDAHHAGGQHEGPANQCGEQGDNQHQQQQGPRGHGRR